MHTHELPDLILKDMQKSGFPLEIEVGSQFSNKLWNVRHQALFLDSEEQKSRYVDLAATKLFIQDFHKFDRLNYTVICECKKSDKPWVFYTPSTTALTDEKDLTTLSTLKFLVGERIHFRELYILYVNHYVSKDPTDRLGQAYHIPFAGDRSKRSDGYDQIYAAISQAIKATVYNMMRLKEYGLASVPKLLMVYYPLVVLDGPMFQYTLPDGKGAKLEPTSYVKYSSGYLLPPTVKEWSDSFIVDIVTKEFLPTYLDWLDEEMEALLKRKVVEA